MFPLPDGPALRAIHIDPLGFSIFTLGFFQLDVWPMRAAPFRHLYTVLSTNMSFMCCQTFKAGLAFNWQSSLLEERSASNKFGLLIFFLKWSGSWREDKSWGSGPGCLLVLTKTIPDLGVISAGPSLKGELFEDFSHVGLNLHFEFSFKHCGWTRAPTENYNIPKYPAWPER